MLKTEDRQARVVLECESARATEECTQILQHRLSVHNALYRAVADMAEHVDRVGRFLHVTAGGVPEDIYMNFWRFCQERGHTVALVSVTDCWTDWDVYNMERLQASDELLNHTAMFERELSRLLQDYLAKVDVASYPMPKLKDIVSICRLGEDLGDGDEMIAKALQAWAGAPKGYDIPRELALLVDNYQYWIPSYRRGESGTNLVARVMIHLIYRSTLPGIAGHSRATAGVQQMSLQ